MATKEYIHTMQEINTLHQKCEYLKQKLDEPEKVETLEKDQDLIERINRLELIFKIQGCVIFVFTIVFLISLLDFS